jgi:hypothetical protein
MNRDALIAAMKATAATPPRKITVPGWGDVYVKALTVEQVDLQQQEPAVDGKDRFRFARGAARMLCDESGALLFDADKAEDLELLAAQPWDTLKAILVAGGDDSATTQAGAEAAKKA